MKLTQEEKRVKLAEAEGWTDIRTTGGLFTRSRLTGCIPGDSQRLPVPNYFGDHNAIHAFEKTLTEEQWRDYTTPLGARDTSWEGAKKLRHSSAAECAESLGLALELWKET